MAKLSKREENKRMYIARVLSLNKGGADEDKLIKEAIKKFNKVNKIG